MNKYGYLEGYVFKTAASKMNDVFCRLGRTKEGK